MTYVTIFWTEHGDKQLIQIDNTDAVKLVKAIGTEQVIKARGINSRVHYIRMDSVRMVTVGH